MLARTVCGTVRTRLCSQLLTREYGAASLPYRLKGDVQEALNQGKPIVAIESSSFALGVPYPDNKHLIMEIIQSIKTKGAVPAVIGVADRQVLVGMSEHDIDKLIQDKPYRASARNLAYAIQQDLRATSTISAAVAVADLVGIKVVTTSGIGGVQQGGHESLDISPDLIALSKSGCAVVCSGVSPVYDIPRTLEYLDTHEVTTLTLGSSAAFPALMCRDSGAQAPGCLGTPVAFASMLRIKTLLQIKGGTLLAVPAPEHLAIANDVYNSAVAQAEMEASFEESDRKGVLTQRDLITEMLHGEELANYLFTRVDEITEHSISRAIKGLLLHNAIVAAEVAAEFAKKNS